MSTSSKNVFDGMQVLHGYLEIIGFINQSNQSINILCHLHKSNQPGEAYETGYMQYRVLMAGARGRAIIVPPLFPGPL